MFYINRSIFPTLLASIAICLSIGCEQAPKVKSSLELVPGEKTELSSADRLEIQNTFRSITQGHEIVNMPMKAIYGVRWSDVPLAVAYACNEEGVEMAIVEEIKQDWGYTFILKTVEDRPAELQVHKLDDKNVYQATASVGRFNDDRERADKLLAAFDQKMRAFGSKPGFEDD